MKTTRQKIIEYLQVKGVSSALDIGRAQHLTAANIRHHLDALEELGAVEVIGTQKGEGRGRPSRLYALTRHTTAHNLDSLAAALLQETSGALSPEERRLLLERIARRMAGQSALSRSFTQRISRAVQRLNEMNYQARWEARPQAPRLILGHCPYASILPKHPELCQMDAALLVGLLGSAVSQTARLERSQQGLPQCMFSIEMKGRKNWTG